MSHRSSSSTSRSNSSSDISNNTRISNKSVDISHFIVWNSVEGKLSKFSDTLQQLSSSERLFILKSKCLSPSCGCILKNHDWFFSRTFVDVKLLVGKWNKLKFSKSTIPETERVAKFILFRQYPDWFEIMNENLDVIPFWTNTNQIVQNKPKSFLIRKDTKCLVLKEASDESAMLFDFVNIKSGTVLGFLNCKKYPMRKGRKIKEQNLIKCKDKDDLLYFFMTDEAIYASPTAGPENISGAHTLQTIIDKFHFPLNIKSIFMNAPAANVACTERHFLNLSERYQLDLIFVSPYNESKRLFIITPGLFEDHVFTIGEFLPQSVTRYTYPDGVVSQIDVFRNKIDEFFFKCHKFDTLGYLLKFATNTSKVQPKFEVTDPEFDDIYLEVEDIYFYIRNGYFPRKSVKLKTKPSLKSEVKVDPVEVVKPIVDVTKSSSENSSYTSSSETESSNDNDDNNSSNISTTSSESDMTSSTALEISKNHNTKRAKSMPLSKKKPAIPANFNSSHCNIDLTIDDMINLSMMGVCVPNENNQSVDADLDHKFHKECAIKFYQTEETQRLKVLNLENVSFKNTAV